MGISISLGLGPGDEEHLQITLSCDTDHGFPPATIRREFEWYPDVHTELTRTGWMIKPGLILCPACRKARPDLKAELGDD